MTKHSNTSSKRRSRATQRLHDHEMPQTRRKNEVVSGFGAVLPQIRITPRRLRESLTTAELLTLFMFSVYAVLGCIYAAEVNNALTFVMVNCCFMWMQCALAVSVAETGSGRVFRSLLLARRFFLLPAIYFIYSQAHLYITHINPRDYDNVLAQWDFSLFGVYPTLWIYQFAHPILTEFLQICYFLYFWIPLSLGAEFYATRPTLVYIRYSLYVACVSYALYLGYFFMPAIGPCFTLHDFSLLNRELPGLFFTEPLRAIVNNGSGAGTSAPHITAHRNCMPSGHTMVTLLNMMIAFRWNSRFRWIYFIIGSGIIVSTVYLRYHYVVDLLAGAVVTVLALVGGRVFERLLSKMGFLNA